MNLFTKIHNYAFSIKQQHLLFGVLFFAIWLLLFLKGFRTPLAHDEIATKWSYMIDWNPFPYMGYVDANNHFSNSLLGGLFIRVFGTDAAWVIRLPNLLCFPIYFWGLYRLRFFLNSQLNVLLLLVLTGFTVYIVEYFALARGYGISVAFMILAIERSISFANKSTFITACIAVLAWIIAIYSNLSLIPIALFGIVHISWLIWKQTPKLWLIIPALSLFPFIYLINYALHLKELGKLYLGGQDGFFENTVHSLSGLIWNTEGLWLNILLGLVTLLIVGAIGYVVIRNKQFLMPWMVFPLYLLMAIAAIILQHLVFGVNFPEHRSAIHLAVLFFVSVVFVVDQLKLTLLSIPIALLTLTLFSVQIKIDSSRNYAFDHFDPRLNTLIPLEVNGIPPSTAGGYWRMDNELSQADNVPVRAFQIAFDANDTLADFIVDGNVKRPHLAGLYDTVFHDGISDKVLLRRKTFLNRELITAAAVELSDSNEFHTVLENKSDTPLFFRVSGSLQVNSRLDQFHLVCSGQDTLTHEQTYYTSLPLVESCKPDKSGSIHFDYTVMLNKYSRHQKATVYFWNQGKTTAVGWVKVEAYRVW